MLCFVLLFSFDCRVDRKGAKKTSAKSVEVAREDGAVWVATNWAFVSTTRVSKF